MGFMLNSTCNVKLGKTDIPPKPALLTKTQHDFVVTYNLYKNHQNLKFANKFPS